jgi:hypothetical protein
MPPHAPPAAPPTDAQVQSQIVNFLWAIAELLRDAFKKSENQNVILPFTVLRRLDYALEPAKKKVLELNAKLIAKGLENRHDALCRASGYAFYNTSPLNYDAILDDPAHLKRNLQHYIVGFSENVQEIFRRFKFDDVLRDLEQVGRLYAVMEKFNEKSKINLRPRSEDNPGGLTNHQMGMVFEQLMLAHMNTDTPTPEPPAIMRSLRVLRTPIRPPHPFASVSVSGSWAPERCLERSPAPPIRSLTSRRPVPYC